MKKKNKKTKDWIKTNLFGDFDIDKLILSSSAKNHSFLSPFVNLKTTRVGHETMVTFGIDLFLFLERLDLIPNIEYFFAKETKRPKKLHLDIHRSLPYIALNTEENKLIKEEDKFSVCIKIIRRDLFEESALAPNTEISYWSEYHRFLAVPEKTLFAPYGKDPASEEFKADVKYFENFIIQPDKYPQFVVGQFSKEDKPSEELADKYMSVKFPNVKTIVDWA